jgi:hypothetical protein
VSLIADYHTESLAPGMKQAFELHIEVCSDCGAFLRTYRKTIEITGAFLRLQSGQPAPHKLALGAQTKRSR